MLERGENDPQLFRRQMSDITSIIRQGEGNDASNLHVITLRCNDIALVPFLLFCDGVFERSYSFSF